MRLFLLFLEADECSFPPSSSDGRTVIVLADFLVSLPIPSFTARELSFLGNFNTSLKEYLKTRYACASVLAAPRNDLQLLREFESYKETVAEAATKSFSGYLSIAA